MINPNKKHWKWGPIDGQILYIDYFMEQMIACKNLLNISWSDALVHFKDGKVLFISEYDEQYDQGEKVFNSYILDVRKRKEFYEKWLQIKDEMVELIKKINLEKLKKMTNPELIKSLRKFHKLYDDFWVYGLIPEIANFGGERLLKKAIEEKYPKHSIEIIEALSAPEELSFYQIEELELLNLKLEQKSLEKHQEKYFWIENSYGRTKIVDIGFFKKRMDDVSIEEAKKKIKEIKEFPKKTKQKKEEMIKKYSLSENIRQISSGLSFGIWWQDYRKRFIFMALHAINFFAKELSERHQLNFEDLLFYTEKELEELAEKGEKVNDLEKRREGFVIDYEAKENKAEYFSGRKANELISKYTNIQVDKNIKEIKGIVVSKGKVSGYVKLLAGSRHFDSFREGQILVTAMTSPDFIVAMRKAKAIITDEGGITCHAAIVSRELGKPCIVGTKIATRVLKDNDFVEVDADKGIVKKLEERE